MGPKNRVQKPPHPTLSWLHPPDTDTSETPLDDETVINEAHRDLQNNPLYKGDITGHKSPSEAALALCRMIAKNVDTHTHLDAVFKGSPFFNIHYTGPRGEKWTPLKQRLTYEKVVGSIAYKRLERANKLPEFTNGRENEPAVEDAEEDPTSTHTRSKMEIPPAPELTGVLKYIEDYYNGTAIIPQPDFAKGVAVVIASVLLARHYRTNTTLYTSMYMAFIARSGQGKEHVRTTIHDILDMAGASHLLGASNYGSVLEFHRTLREKTRQIMVQDEAGLNTQMTKSNARAGNNYHQEVQTALLEVWGRCNTTHTPNYKPSRHKVTKDQKADMEEVYTPIKKPAVSYVMLSTPSTMMDALSTRDARNGYLSRIFFICGSDKRIKTLPRSETLSIPGILPVPRQIIDWINTYARHGNSGIPNNDQEDGFHENPDHVTVLHDIPIDQDAYACFDAYHAEVITEVERHDAKGNDAISDALQRLSAYAMKVALIFALSEGIERITIDHATRAVQFVKHYSMVWYQTYLKKKLTYVNKYDEIEQNVIQYVKRQNTEWVKKSQIIRKVFKGDLTYDKVLAKLEDQSSLLVRRVGGGTSYRDPEFEP